MKRKIAPFLSVFIFSFITNTTALAKDPPTWVESRPIEPKYYIGIGIAEKKGNEAGYREIAKNAALLDLASEISVTISGTFIYTLIGGLSISAFPLFSGFVSKAMIVAAGFEEHLYWAAFLLTLASAGTFLHTGLKARVMSGASAGWRLLSFP